MAALPVTPGSLVFYDDATARKFEPFALSRPQCEMRVGALLMRERWEFALGTTSAGFVGAPHLSAFEEFDAPCAVDGGEILPAGTIVVNARAAVALEQLDTSASGWVIAGRLAAVRLVQPLSVQALADGSRTLEAIQATHDAPAAATSRGVWLDEVWDAIRHLSPLLAEDIPALARSCRVGPCRQHCKDPVITGEHAVYAESDAVIEPFTLFDTHLGPVLLRRGAHVQAFTRMVGPCYVGRGSTVTADKISGSAIGDTCRVHGELSASILIGHSNKGHDGFVGHSVLGRWVNLGAGTTTSNLKNTYGSVALWTPDGVRDTGLQFLGTMFGDHVKTGIGLRLTTGCVLGAGANVVDAMPPKVVAPFSWGARAPYDLFDEQKFVETAARVMQRRQVVLGAEGRRHLQAMHSARWSAP